MTPLKLILRSFLYSYLMDNFRNPNIELLSTSEGNISSHVRSSLETLKRFHRQLVPYQVDMEPNQIITGTISEKLIKSMKANETPGIFIHKRGTKIKDSGHANYLCLDIKKIRGFKGDTEKIKSKRQIKRLTIALEKLKSLRKSRDFKYEYSVSIVISDPQTIFLKVNDEDFKRCMIQHISPPQMKRYIDIIHRVIFITMKHDFSEKAIYQAKVTEYEKEINQIISDCLS